MQDKFETKLTDMIFTSPFLGLKYLVYNHKDYIYLRAPVSSKDLNKESKITGTDSLYYIHKDFADSSHNIINFSSEDSVVKPYKHFSTHGFFSQQNPNPGPIKNYLFTLA